MDNPSMFCHQCGAKVGRDDKFCLSCGCNLEDDQVGLDILQDNTRPVASPPPQPSSHQPPPPSHQPSPPQPPSHQPGPRPIYRDQCQHTEYEQPYPPSHDNQRRSNIVPILAIALTGMVAFVIIMFVFIRPGGEKPKDHRGKGIIPMEENFNITKNTDEDIAMDNAIDVAKQPVPEKDIHQGLESQPITPSSYLPEPGKVLLFFHQYPDGESGFTEEYIGKARDFIGATQLSLIAESEPYIMHFVEYQDGIYVVDDSSPDFKTLWLPSDLSPGKHWETQGTMCTILEVGVPVTVGQSTFENCIVREHDLGDVGVVLVEHIAPGLGVVYCEYKGGGMAFELREIRDIGLDNANSMVDKYSLNQDSVY